MTTKELLEKAAKAAGLPLSEEFDLTTGDFIYIGIGNGDLEVWDPLGDDGDAFRLAVKLNLGFSFNKHSVDVSLIDLGYWHSVSYGQDKEAATRLAIVRAAAAIAEGRE